MTTEQSPRGSDQPPLWGAPTPGGAQPSGGKRWTGRRTALAAAITLGVAAAAGGAVYAAASGGATGSGGAGFGAGHGDGGPGGGRMDGPGGRMGGLGGLTDALHGEFTVAGTGGGYVTELMQTGTVSTVDANSITAKSADGYTKTYPVTSATSVDGATGQIGVVKTSDTVTVIAAADSTAISVLDRAQLGQGGGQFGPPGGQGRPGGGSGGTQGG